MQSKQLHKDSSPCIDARSLEPTSIALISVGNARRTDDGIARAVCEALPEHIKKRVCRFHLEGFTGGLIDYLNGHDVAIIVDATMNDLPLGTISISDISLDRAICMNLGSCRGFSLADELRLARGLGMAPKTAVLFGIEVKDTSEGDNLGPGLQRQVPGLVERLAALIKSTLETAIRA